MYTMKEVKEEDDLLMSGVSAKASWFCLGFIIASVAQENISAVMKFTRTDMLVYLWVVFHPLDRIPIELVPYVSLGLPTESIRGLYVHETRNKYTGIDCWVSGLGRGSLSHR